MLFCRFFFHAAHLLGGIHAMLVLWAA